jgi:hypothetical protein
MNCLLCRQEGTRFYARAKRPNKSVHLMVFCNRDHELYRDTIFELEEEEPVEISRELALLYWVSTI